MGRYSFAMNAKLTLGSSSLTNGAGTSILQEIYSSRANQDKYFYYILGNKQLQKRIDNFNKHGNKHLYLCS